MKPHIQGQVGQQVLATQLGEKGNLNLDIIGADPNPEVTMKQDIGKEDMKTEVKAEREEGEMEQIEPKSSTMGIQVDPEGAAGRLKV